MNEEQRDSEFLEAAHYWLLEKLYIDLAGAKGKSLTPVEKKFLRGLLCGYSPAEIAELVYQSRSSSAVRVYLSNGLYKYIQELLIRQTGEFHKIKSWSRVTNLLTKAGYKLTTPLEREPPVEYPREKAVSSDLFPNATPLENCYGNWEEIIDVSRCYGRQGELEQLAHWILDDRCRLLCLLGLAGVGKTLLAGRLIQQIQEQFTAVIWRSLRHAPSCGELLTDLLHTLMPNGIGFEDSVELRMSQLLDYLRSHRCLILLDQGEYLLASGTLAGVFRSGYESYGELLRRLAEERHGSCLLLTSREKPQDFALWEGSASPVRSLEILGLAPFAARELLAGLRGSPSEFGQLVQQYGGNPLALKWINTVINDLFNGDITGFLRQDVFIFSNLRRLLQEQFARLSESEHILLNGIILFPQGIKTFPIEGIRGLSRREQLEAVESLRRRSLLEKQGTGFVLSPLVRSYCSQE